MYCKRIEVVFVSIVGSMVLYQDFDLIVVAKIKYNEFMVVLDTIQSCIGYNSKLYRIQFIVALDTI